MVHLVPVSRGEGVLRAAVTGQGRFDGRIVEHRGLWAVALPAGQHRVALRSSDPLIVAGSSTAAPKGPGMVLWSLLGWRRRFAGVGEGSSNA